MLREGETVSQREYEIVLLEELVAEDHLLRKIDRAVDFGFIHELCKDLYSPNIGRPAVPPELLFRMLFLGYLYGIKSEVKLAQMVNEDIAFKWFWGLS
ncbi:MAG: transposase [Christensenellaceae bacterium]|nr:transposase [Christensenellaceae bacterium]MEA5067081.1 transposase [Eubacteriales bacterium]MEA5069219.1 transposase [Christensenellaceae bacterium]